MHTFIIHVSKGFEARRQHIDTHLPAMGVRNFEYVLDGDIDFVKSKVSESFFSESLSWAQRSCFYKHYLAMKMVVDRGLPYALVLEDDALLVKDFSEKLQRITEQLTAEKNYFVNIEQASNAVPFSFRKPGKLIYPCKVNKLCGGILYDYTFAKACTEYIESKKVTAPIDGFIGNERCSIGFNLFWAEPSLVKQGSKSGLFDSGISQEKSGVYLSTKSLFKNLYRIYVLSNFKKKQKELFMNVERF
ncbi:glycosyltransferase family 25 protein [Alginatibacterium sediminis]|nr:glycosyltransferase family 25 protein [Alginatibacterium sediminis]